MTLFKELASRGVSQKTWDKWDSNKRREYLKANPTSRYAEKVIKEKPVRMNWKQGYNELKQENAELRQRLEALERFIKGANPNLTPAQSSQVAQELEIKLSSEYTDKVNGIIDSLEDAYDSTIDDAIFGLLDAFPELQDKFVSNGDIDSITAIPSKADKLELLAQMLKSLRKEDLDKVLDKIGAKKEESKDDMDVIREAFFNKFPNANEKDFMYYIHPSVYKENDSLSRKYYQNEDYGKLIDEDGNITDYKFIDIADEFLGVLRQFDLITGMNLESMLDDENEIRYNNPSDEVILQANCDYNFNSNFDEDIEKLIGSPMYQKFSEKYGLEVGKEDFFICLSPINKGGFEKYKANKKESYKYETNPKKIAKLLDKAGIKNYTINKDGSIDINKDTNRSWALDLNNINALTDENGHLKVKFNKCEGDVYLDGYHFTNNFKSLEGFPKTIIGNLEMPYVKNIETFEGGPEDVIGNFKCDGCLDLKDLKGLPHIKGNAEIGNQILMELRDRNELSCLKGKIDGFLTIWQDSCMKKGTEDYEALKEAEIEDIENYIKDDMGDSLIDITDVDLNDDDERQNICNEIADECGDYYIGDSYFSDYRRSDKAHKLMNDVEKAMGKSVDNFF